MCVLAALLLAAPADDRHFLVRYGAQGAPYRTLLTHTWATVVRVGPAGVQSDTISWMPATLDIRPLAVVPEPGVNLTLADTFAWVRSWDGAVSVWGPFEVRADKHRRFLARKAELDGGGVRYRALGSVSRDDLSISNCGQSFTRVFSVIGRKYVQPTPLPGKTGTSLLAERVIENGLVIDPAADHGWVLPLAGVDPAAVTRRRPGDRVPRR
jgi:hypothetical protein